MILKLEKINFTVNNILFFLKDVDINKVLVSKKFLEVKKILNKIFRTFFTTRNWLNHEPSLT